MIVQDVSEWHVVFFNSDWEEMKGLTCTVFGFDRVMAMLRAWRHCQLNHHGLPWEPSPTHNCMRDAVAVDIAMTFDVRKGGV